MLNWEDCKRFSVLEEDEKIALGDIEPSTELLEFVLESYLLESNLNLNPGIKTAIIEDIEEARKNGYLELAALLRKAIYYRLTKAYGAPETA